MPQKINSFIVVHDPADADPLEVSKDNPLPSHEVALDREVQGAMKQVSVATSATLIVAANTKRKSVAITNITGTQQVFLGLSASVSATNGDLLGATVGSSNVYLQKGAIWGIAVSSAQTVSVSEESETV